MLLMQRARNHLEAALELVEESGFGLSRYIGEYNFKLAKVEKGNKKCDNRSKLTFL